MVKIAGLLLFTVSVSAGIVLHSYSKPVEPDRARTVETANAIEGDGCVTCHSKISTASALSSKFLEWQASAHAARGIGCEKCHGGDPTSKNQSQAHRGVFPPSDSRSSLNASNVAARCGDCHKAIARSFVESPHYQRLKSSGMGPSCTSCHGHMGSSVRRSPSEAEALCTYCHNAVNGVLPQRPDIAADSRATVDAIQRTEYMLTSIDQLLADADKRGIDAEAEKKEVASTKASIEGAKIAWHTFNLTGVMEMANKAFANAVEIRNRLNDKLNRH